LKICHFLTIASNRTSIDKIPETQIFPNYMAISLLILSAPLTMLGTSTAAYCCHGVKNVYLFLCFYMFFFKTLGHNRQKLLPGMQQFFKHTILLLTLSLLLDQAGDWHSSLLLRRS
jgi:Flp pilus assembly protein protease CpaA